MDRLYDTLHAQIRLLRISQQAGTKDAPADLHFELAYFSLRSPKCPKYHALSYAWGKTGEHPIFLNGVKVLVRDNLYNFLVQASTIDAFGQESWWWVDAICINQNDSAEKPSQLKLMGDIYKEATKVIVWLGVETEQSRSAADSIRHLYDMRWTWDTDDDLQFRKLRTSNQVDWAAVQNLLLLPWWTRVWTLQEFLLAKKLVFYWGRHPLEGDVVRSAMFATYLAGGADDRLIDKAAFDAGWNRRRMRQFKEAVDDGKIPVRMRLVAMLAYIGDSDATDPRDRLYSLLGLCDQADRQLVKEPDYELPVEELYTNLVISFVKKFRNLDIICFAHLFRSRDPSRNLVPSWVPDWTVHVRCEPVPVMASQSATLHIGNFRALGSIPGTARYNASKDLEPQVHFMTDVRWTTGAEGAVISDDVTLLLCRGIQLDTIDGLGGMVKAVSKEKEECIQSTEVKNLPRHKRGRRTISSRDSDILDVLVQSLVLDRSDRYLDHKLGSRDKTFGEEFLAACHGDMKTSATIQGQWKEWYALNKDLLIRGASFQERVEKFKTSETLLTSGRCADTQHTDSFIARWRDTVRTMSRRLMVTADGNIGMAPAAAKKGDIVCVLFGCSIPVVLREGNNDGTYALVGECYVHGFMEGEAIADWKAEYRDTRIFPLR
ncbi:hypothetical protein BP5796_08388 [Coleophoma crateriformis]|uniref:Heterokaryon incompatibility domain-containing protein n=1 Tax=Coleophoma crateriformis TaxID=565419 RepID=A0A3D8R7R1_9HELO|nr:hypothetical protein BP5796_08388 [Coleophoma crateriformis]